jgi:hypothetical protein
MNVGDQTMNPPLQKVCLPISIPTYVVWLMKMIAEAQMRIRRMKEVFITKIQSLEELTKEHEEMKCSHVDLV